MSANFGEVASSLLLIECSCTLVDSCHAVIHARDSQEACLWGNIAELEEPYLYLFHQLVLHIFCLVASRHNSFDCSPPLPLAAALCSSHLEAAKTEFDLVYASRTHPRERGAVFLGSSRFYLYGSWEG